MMGEREGVEGWEEVGAALACWEGKPTDFGLGAEAKPSGLAAVILSELTDLSRSAFPYV